MYKFATALAGATIVAVGAASGQSVTFSTPFSGTVGQADFTVTLPQFDQSFYGPLTSVELTLTADTSAGSITFDNEADSPSNVTLGIGAEVSATAPSALTLVAVPLQTASGTVDADNDGAADFLGSDSFAVVGGTGTDDDSNTLTSGFAPYLGTSTFDVIIGNSVQTSLSSGGGFGPIDPSPGNFSGTVEVTYTYVPEPASLALLAAGLGVAGLRRRSA